LIESLLLLFLIGQQLPPPPRIVEGRSSPSVSAPRIAAEIQIDGSLDEPPWSQAARLTGFSQYRPVHESLRFSMPSGPVQVILKKRDRQNALSS